MSLYLKIISLLKPYWKHVVLSLIFTTFYIVFNGVSLWISVDFIQEIFQPESTASVQTEQVEPEAVDPAPSSGIDNLKEKLSVYQQINQQLKTFIIQENKLDTLKMICLVIFLSFLFKNLFAFLKHITINFVQLKIIVQLRTRLYSTLIRLPLSYFNKHDSGRLTSIAFNDVVSINNVLNDSMHKMILSPLQIIFYLILLISISPKLSLITFTIIPASGFIIIKIGQSMRRKSRRVLTQISNVMALFGEVISGIRIVKAFNAEEKEDIRFQKENDVYFKHNYRANRLKRATSPLNETLGALILCALLWYGGNMVYGHTGLEAEHFIRFLVFLFAMFQPMRDLSGINNSIQTAIAAAERIWKVTEEEREIYSLPDSKKLDSFEEGIKLKNISFRYTEDDPLVLQNIDLSIKKSETVAFVGHSGSGKSTLMNLIPRFYDLEKGEILVDQINTKQLDLHSLRDKIGIVTQDVILFNDTIRANITYGSEEVSDEAIISAAKIANAWEFIEKMENGLDTVIGERGGRLSGGQKQRVSIARAVLKNPPILILDEATSALDTESEKLVQLAIENLMENRTVLVIAHRLSTVLHSDKIVVMNDGRIEDIGAHQDLLKSCDLYRKLYEIQFNDENIDDGA